MSGRDDGMGAFASHERLLLLSGVAAMVVLSGAHLFWRPDAELRSSAAHGWLMFAMWGAMLLAVMSSAAAPMLSVRSARGRDVPATYFAGLLSTWAGISAGAALASWALHASGLLSPDLIDSNSMARGILLVSIGGYQLTPLRAACFGARRTATRAHAEEWRGGVPGGILSGACDGIRCVGRCWPLMALLFVGGIMSPLWIAVLTLIVLADEILPFGEPIAHGVAVGAIGWGLWMLAGMLV